MKCETYKISGFQFILKLAPFGKEKLFLHPLHNVYKKNKQRTQ